VPTNTRAAVGLLVLDFNQDGASRLPADSRGRLIIALRRQHVWTVRNERSRRFVDSFRNRIGRRKRSIGTANQQRAEGGRPRAMEAASEVSFLVLAPDPLNRVIERNAL
jgi:hypothetical protein